MVNRKIRFAYFEAFGYCTAITMIEFENFNIVETNIKIVRFKTTKVRRWSKVNVDTQLVHNPSGPNSLSIRTIKMCEKQEFKSKQTDGMLFVLYCLWSIAKISGVSDTVSNE
jgi:hypothetical protein